MAPELLSNTSQSPYRTAFEHGYRWLRFEPALERLFQDFYAEAHLVRVRLAGFLAILLFALFVLIDFTTMPAQVADRTVSIRVGLIAILAIGIWIGYHPKWNSAYRIALFAASLLTGLGTAAIIGVALVQAHPLPYEGILLVPSFIYMVICLPWWRAVLANTLTLAAFIAMELAYNPDPQSQLYQIVFMCAANAIAAYGGYFLEYTTRTTFLVHALLNELAERDGLTGLFNRRTLDSHLDRVWRQGLRDGTGLAIAMIDVDYFKRYNDRYGHAQGDAALKAVADVVASIARRPLDLAARYGGEEFVVVWYHPAPSEMTNMGEQLRAGVERLALPHLSSDAGHVSVSVGTAFMLPIAGQSAAELLDVADAALFQAKDQGRNRVVALVHSHTQGLLAAKADVAADLAERNSPGQQSVHEVQGRLDL
jgi:diguanylate cyclase (GGDEF)-like protein